MGSRKSLVDTSAWIETLRVDGDPDVRAAVLEATVEGNAFLCDMVRLELWNGARGAAEHRMLRDLESELECVATTQEVWNLASEIGQKCRKNGVTVPSTDLLVFACAWHRGLSLIHVDSHYVLIEEVAGRLSSDFTPSRRDDRERGE